MQEKFLKTLSVVFCSFLVFPIINTSFAQDIKELPKEIKDIKETIKEQEKKIIKKISRPESKVVLYIKEPKDKTKTSKNFILVKGVAKRTSKLLINNKNVPINELSNTFITKVNLTSIGTNLITFIAYDAKDIPLKVIRRVELLKTTETPTKDIIVTKNLENAAHRYYYNGDYQEAAILFKEIITKDPKRTDLYHDLGLCYFKLENFSLAIENLLRAKEYDPKNHKIYYNLGSSYYSLEMYKEAVESYDISGKLQPMIRNLVDYKIGKTYFKAGNYKEAKDYLSKVIKSKESDTITIAAKKLMLIIDPELYAKLSKPEIPLDLHFYLSGRRDNNATFSPSKTAATKDNLASFYFYTGFGWMIPSTSPLFLTYTYYASDYAAYQSRNLIGHLISTGLRKRIKPTLYWRMVFDLSYYYLGRQETFYFLGGKDTLYISSWALKNQLIWKTPGLSNGWTYLEYNRTPLEFHLIYSHKEFEHTFTFKEYFSKNWDTYLSYTNLNSITDRAYNSIAFGGSYNHDLAWSSNFKIDLDLERFGYKAATATGTTDRRHDFRTTLTISLSKQFWNNTKIALNFQSVNNSSNDSTEKYNKQVTYLSLLKSF